MQFKQKLAYIALVCTLLLSGAVLFMNVRAQAPRKAQIVFHSYRDWNFEIYVMDADGKNQRNLTNNPASDYGRPSWFDPAFAYSVSPAGRLKGTWGWIKQSNE